MSLLKAGDPITDALQVMDLFEHGLALSHDAQHWCFLICTEGPVSNTVTIVDNAPVEGLEDCVATLREAFKLTARPFTGVYAAHHNKGQLTYPVWIPIEEES